VRGKILDSAQTRKSRAWAELVEGFLDFAELPKKAGNSALLGMADKKACGLSRLSPRAAAQ
jgi:hypothetical protein